MAEINSTNLLHSTDRPCYIADVAMYDPEDRWLTAREVAELTGWNLATVRAKMHRDKFGELKRKGSFLLIDREALKGVTVRRYTRTGRFVKRKD